MTLNPEILTQSSIARSEALGNCDREKALALLEQVRAYEFGTFEGKEYATTEEIASFYEAPLKTVQKIAERNRTELKGYGLKTLRGEELKFVTDSMSVSKNVRQLMLWTPTAALAVGLMLEASAVAKTVRQVTVREAIGKPPVSASTSASKPQLPPAGVRRRRRSRVVGPEYTWPRLLCRQVSGVDVYVEVKKGTSGLTVEGLAAITGVETVEIEELAWNLSDKREGVTEAFRGIRKDKVYVVEEYPALVNGKGREEGLTVYHHEFCEAVLTQASRNGYAVAIALKGREAGSSSPSLSSALDFFTPLGGLNAWSQTITGWGRYFGVEAERGLEVSYRQLEAELMWEELAQAYPDEEEREGEYAMYFGVRPITSMQIGLPSRKRLPVGA